MNKINVLKNQFSHNDFNKKYSQTLILEHKKNSKIFLKFKIYKTKKKKLKIIKTPVDSNRTHLISWSRDSGSVVLSSARWTLHCTDVVLRSRWWTVDRNEVVLSECLGWPI